MEEQEKPIKATIHLGTYTVNQRGGKVMSTRYSMWDEVEFNTMKEAMSFGNGCLCGLRYKWKSAAVAMDFHNGKIEYFT